LQTSIIFLM